MSKSDSPEDRLSAFRAARQEELALPSGLTMIVKKINLLELVAAGQLDPARLGQAQAFLERAYQSTDKLAISVEEFPTYAAVADAVVIAAAIDPAVAAVGDAAHLGLDELSIADRLHIFNWVQGEGAQLPASARPKPRKATAADTPAS